jgi:hypothetical protein
VKKCAGYCGSTEKCQFTLCIAIFSALNVGPAALYDHSALYGPAAHIQRQSQRTEKCHFTPFIAVFSVLKTSIFFTRDGYVQVGTIVSQFEAVEDMQLALWPGNH